MSTRQLNQLCLLILKDVYGELAATVVGILLERGRLTASGIGHMCNLPLATVQRTLIALIQNRFVQHWTEKKSSVYYTAHWPKIYAILWTGQMLAIMNETGDAATSEVVKNLHIYGHMRIKDFVEAYSGAEEQQNVQDALVRLLKDRMLAPTFEFDFHPMEDIYGQFYSKRMQDMATEKKAESAKATLAKAQATNDLELLFSKKTEQNAGLIVEENRDKMKVMPKQRRLAMFNSSEKKYTANPNCIVSVNHEKFLVISRNRQLVELAAKRVGVITARVYAAVLKWYETKVNSCKDELTPGTDNNVTSLEVTRQLDSTLNLEESVIGPAPKHRLNIGDRGSGAKRLKTSTSYLARNSNGELTAGDDDDDDEGEDFKGSSKKNQKADLDVLNRHLEVLADSSVRFLQKVGTRGGGEWFVPFQNVVEDLKRVTYDSIVFNKFGAASNRILRVIRDKGKVDERMLSQLTLLQSKDIRNHLSDLQGIGGVDLQEVPRGNDRAPTRTFYLWFHRPNSAYSQILQDLYQAMNRIYARMVDERNRNPTLVIKLQREDVKGHENEYLSEMEKKELTEMQLKEQRLLGQLFRIDQLVRIFRDY